MSSTSRGGKREASDYYCTPQWAILEFLREFTADSGPFFGDDISSHDLIVLDPTAGGDAARPMAYPEAIAEFNRQHTSAGRGNRWDTQILRTVDIRPDSRAQVKADYLQWDVREMGMTPDIVITNPPFALALPIIEKALRDVRGGGFVIMLLRLNFFGGQYEKREFFERIGTPVAAYVHRKRMSFHPPGTLNAQGKPMQGDSIEYAHFVWQAGIKPKWTMLRVIGTESQAETKNQKLATALQPQLIA